MAGKEKGPEENKGNKTVTDTKDPEALLRKVKEEAKKSGTIVDGNKRADKGGENKNLG